MIRIPRVGGTAVFLAAWLMPWRPAYKVRAAGSRLKFFVHYRDLIGRHIAKYGTHERVPTRWLGNYLTGGPNGIFIDVGANLGWHAVHAAQHQSVETVVAFEPDPFNAWLLDRNLTENGVENVIVSNAAVGAQSGSIRLHRYRSTNYGRHSLLTDYGYGPRMVPIVDLDGALHQLGLADRPVNVLKIDVEGYEPAVIAGATKTLERTAAVMLEYSPDLSSAGGLSGQDMVDRPLGAGFEPFGLDQEGRAVPISAGKLRAFTGEMDLVMIKPAAS
jgi:FkbM family methyltransferase